MKPLFSAPSVAQLIELIGNEDDLMIPSIQNHPIYYPRNSGAREGAERDDPRNNDQFDPDHTKAKKYP